MTYYYKILPHGIFLSAPQLDGCSRKRVLPRSPSYTFQRKNGRKQREVYFNEGHENIDARKRSLNKLSILYESLEGEI
jgi:hypothetical protein